MATPLYNPYQKYIYPLTTSFFVLWSSGTLSKRVSSASSFKIRTVEIHVWVLAVTFAVVSIFVIAVFYHEYSYKPTPRYVGSPH